MITQTLVGYIESALTLWEAHLSGEPLEIASSDAARRSIDASCQRNLGV